MSPVRGEGASNQERHSHGRYSTRLSPRPAGQFFTTNENRHPIYGGDAGHNAPVLRELSSAQTSGLSSLGRDMDFNRPRVSAHVMLPSGLRDDPGGHAYSPTD